MAKASTFPNGFPFAKFRILIEEIEGLSDASQYENLQCEVTYNSKNESISLKSEASSATKHHARFFSEFEIMMDDLTSPVEILVLDYVNSFEIGKVSVDVLSMTPDDRHEMNEKLVGSKIGGKLKFLCTSMPLSHLPPNFHVQSRRLQTFRLSVESSKIEVEDYLEGLVTFMTPVQIKLDRVYLRLFGREIVSWSEYADEGISHYYGESNLINKWFHGWENKSGILDPGYYNWKFRLQIPGEIPPTFDDGYGKISYLLYAYLDHEVHTEGIPIDVNYPILYHTPPEATIAKHNMTVRCSLDKPIYDVQGNLPLTTLISTEIKNFSDHPIKKVKVKIVESAVYIANDKVWSNKVILFRQSFPVDVSGHTDYHHTFAANFPSDYHKLTMSKAIHTSRIHIVHEIHMTIVKDTPVIDGKVKVVFPVYLSTKSNGKQVKRQAIYLKKDSTLISPPTPQVGRRASMGSHKEAESVEASIVKENEVIQPIPNATVEFDTPPPQPRKQHKEEEKKDSSSSKTNNNGGGGGGSGGSGSDVKRSHSSGHHHHDVEDTYNTQLDEGNDDKLNDWGFVMEPATNGMTMSDISMISNYIPLSSSNSSRSSSLANSMRSSNHHQQQ
eukprot:TRINITY_DN449_c2_g2_i2.p2 TRINITY_DN449_c2_g2~~TRINITY_DN449_c2_g2_i2.p2  ORF type:complete len:613 (-),score=170.50 TRINITY_DN449_c2_g2_i2:2253-4091(-)